MIVDGNGKILEDRRKSGDRRENEFDKEGGRRKDVRRKAEPQVGKNSKKKK